jgi:hypothetical protein
LVVIEAAMTGRETPQARPRAVLLGTKTYGTFLSRFLLGRFFRGRLRRLTLSFPHPQGQIERLLI